MDCVLSKKDFYWPIKILLTSHQDDGGGDVGAENVILLDHEVRGTLGDSFDRACCMLRHHNVGILPNAGLNALHLQIHALRHSGNAAHVPIELLPQLVGDVVRKHLAVRGDMPIAAGLSLNADLLVIVICSILSHLIRGSQSLCELLSTLNADWLPSAVKASELLIVHLALFASLGVLAVPNHVSVCCLAPHPLLDTAVLLLHYALELIGRNPCAEHLPLPAGEVVVDLLVHLNLNAHCLPHEVFGHLPAVVPKVLEHEGGVLHDILKGHALLEGPSGLGKVLPILVADIPVGPLLAAHPFPLLSDGRTAPMLGGDGNTFITVDLAHLRLAHFAVISQDVHRVFIRAGHLHLDSATKDCVINALFFVLLIVVYFVHGRKLLAGDNGPPLLASDLQDFDLCCHALLQHLVGFSIWDTTLDEEIRKILVLLVDKSAFLDVALHVEAVEVGVSGELKDVLPREGSVRESPC